MKKVISLALAIVMMMAVAVPAFAGDITQDDPAVVDGKQTTQAEVVTTYDNATDWSYTVTIPAGVTVAWNDTTAQAMTYKVESQLLIGASLKISAAADNGGVMTATGTDDELVFTVAGGDAVEFGAVNPANTTAPDVVDGTNVSVTIADFSGKAVGAYSGTLTYTGEYVAPTTV